MHRSEDGIVGIRFIIHIVFLHSEQGLTILSGTILYRLGEMLMVSIVSTRLVEVSVDIIHSEEELCIAHHHGVVVTITTLLPQVTTILA